MNLSATETLLMPVFVFLLMLGMGATLSVDSFRRLLKQPVPALIGLASQYGWMPLISLALDLSPPVGAFWSTTMNDAKKRLMTENSINRYKIGSADKLKANADGSTTIYIQNE